MRVVHSETPLPKVWQDLPHGDLALDFFDLQVTRRSRLRIKLCVFPGITALRKFWRHALTVPVPARGCFGLCTRLSCVVIPPEGPRYYRVDPTYICAIGLLKSELSMEIITHESVHAACAYLDRVRGTLRVPDADVNAEEPIAYAVGRIAARVNAALRTVNYYV